MNNNQPINPDPEQIESLLHRRLGNHVRNLRVQIVDQGLVIEGHTATYYAKQIAQHAAMEVTGLPVFANEIEVR